MCKADKEAWDTWAAKDALSHGISYHDFLQAVAEAEAATEAAEALKVKEAVEDNQAKRRQTKATEYFSPSSSSQQKTQVCGSPTKTQEFFPLRFANLRLAAAKSEFGSRHISNIERQSANQHTHLLFEIKINTVMWRLQSVG